MIAKYLLGLATAATMVYFLGVTRKSTVQRLFVMAVFGGGLVLILRPEWSNALAAWVGIGRGADLVLYASTLFLVSLSFNFYLRFRRIDDQMATLVRELALARAVAPDGDHSEDAAP